MIRGFSKYKNWYATSTFFGSCTSTISTANMLKSFMPVPGCSEILTATYVGKDIIGQLGSLWYIRKNARVSDRFPVKTATRASCVQNLAFYAENFANCLPPLWILPFLGVTNLVKNITFVNVGAVNTACLQRLSTEKIPYGESGPLGERKQVGIGELYSKLTVVNTLASSLGMITGLGILYFLPSERLKAFVILPMFSLASVFCLRKAVKHISEGHTPVSHY